MAVRQQEPTLGEAADQLARALPGHRGPVPESVGVTLELSVDTLLDGED